MAQTTITMNIKKNSKRKAISPILATVILIAITLVAAVAIAGFVFGLFGSLGSSANLSVVTVSCSVSGTPDPTGFSGTAAANTCFLLISNSGTAKGTVSACSIGGVPGTLSAAVSTTTSAITVAGSGSIGAECSAATSALGQALSGTITTGNLAVSFAGTWTA